MLGAQHTHGAAHTVRAQLLLQWQLTTEVVATAAAQHLALACTKLVYCALPFRFVPAAAAAAASAGWSLLRPLCRRRRSRRRAEPVAYLRHGARRSALAGRSLELSQAARSELASEGEPSPTAPPSGSEERGCWRLSLARSLALNGLAGGAIMTRALIQ